MLDEPMTSKMIMEKDGAIGRLIFNNPARHNAVSLEMWEAVTQIIDEHWQRLIEAWDAKYPENPVSSAEEEVDEDENGD